MKIGESVVLTHVPCTRTTGYTEYAVKVKSTPYTAQKRRIRCMHVEYGVATASSHHIRRVHTVYGVFTPNTVYTPDTTLVNFVLYTAYTMKLTMDMAWMKFKRRIRCEEDLGTSSMACHVHVRRIHSEIKCIAVSCLSFIVHALFGGNTPYTREQYYKYILHYVFIYGLTHGFIK